MTGTRGLDRQILRLALPAFGALVAQPLFVLIDAAVVGTLGTDALAGLGAASTIFATVVGLCSFLASATTASVARLFGAGQRSDALSQGSDGIALGIGLGIALGVLVALLADPLVRALGTSDDVTPYAVTYLRIIAISFPAVLGVLAAVGVLRGLQDTRTTLLVSLAQVAAQLVLCPVLVLVLRLGIAGSAIATAVAELLGLVLYAGVLLRRARRERARIHPGGAGVLRSARDGVPLFIRTLALRAIFLLAVAVAARLGDEELAAYHVTVTLFFALALALDALAIAGQALLGKTLGASDVAESRTITRRLVWWSLWLGVVLGVVVLVSRAFFPDWFTDDPVVMSLISSALLVIALLQPLAGIVFALDGVLIGAGDTRWLAWAQTAVLIAFLPAAWVVLHLKLGVTALWWALGWSLLVRAIVLAWRARGSTWLVPGAVR
ncbi:MAG: MATE family efflux transporter [Ilumatobacteraceae bacterium]